MKKKKAPPKKGFKPTKGKKKSATDPGKKKRPLPGGSMPGGPPTGFPF